MENDDVKKIQIYSMLGVVIVFCFLAFVFDTEPNEDPPPFKQGTTVETKIEQHVAEPEKALNLGKSKD